MIRKIKGSVKLTIFILICLSFFSKHVHNKLVDEEHLLHIAHGKLEAEMQRRHDLVARCRNAVEKYRDIEEKIQTRIITLHGLTKSRGNTAALLKEKNEFLELIEKLDILKEEYPALKSKEPYVYLMEIIQESGARVTSARLNYNERVYEYNKICRILPYGLFALMLGFEEKPFFKFNHIIAGVKDIDKQPCCKRQSI